MELVARDELCPLYAKFLTDFSKCKNDLLSYHGINISKRIKMTQKYYRETEDAVERPILRECQSLSRVMTNLSLKLMTSTRKIRSPGMVYCDVFYIVLCQR